MATKTQTAAVEKLDQLERAVDEAVARREAVRADRQRAQRGVRTAEAEFESFQELVGAGEEQADPERERELAEAIDAARAAASTSRWEHRVQGAERAVREAEAERDAFGREHFAVIAAEEAPKDGPARDRLQSAFEELQAAEAVFVDRVRRWAYLAPFGGLDPDDLVGLPSRGDSGEVVRRFADGIESPTPRSLTPK
jgi:hypothetical protein